MFSELKKIQAEKLTNKELEEKVAALVLPQPFAYLSSISGTILIPIIWLAPFTLAVAPVVFATTKIQKLIFLGLAPAIFVILMTTAAGIMSLLGRAGVIAGKFPRKPEHPVYALRKIYGAAWTQIYYFKPLYAVCLAIPTLKKLMFNLFGYTGDTNITIFPDTWIRDLPLLKIKKGVYLANRATLGTNMCLNDGSIMVGPITLEEKAIVGHLAVIGLGSKLGKGSELGVNAATGIRITVGENVSLRPRCNLNHGSQIGDNTIIGSAALIGMKTKIGPNIEIRSGASIPPGVVINTQTEADNYFSSETQLLNDERDSLFNQLESGVGNVSYIKGS